MRDLGRHAVSRDCEMATTGGASKETANVHVSTHPLVAHKVTQLRKAGLSAREYQQVMKELSTLVLYVRAHARVPASQDCALVMLITATFVGHRGTGTRRRTTSSSAQRA